MAIPIVQDEDGYGRSLFWLVIGSRSWVHRRVDSLRLDADGGTRRFVSLDMTIPTFAALPERVKTVHVPLTVLSKGPKKRLSIVHGSQSVPVLGRNSNTLLVVAMLTAGLRDFIAATDSQISEGNALLQGVVGEVPAEARKAFIRYAIWSDHEFKGTAADSDLRRKVDEFNALVQLFVDNYLLIAEVGREILGVRTVLKYSLDQPLSTLRAAGLQRIRLSYEVPDFGFAGSQHVECELPPGLSIKNFTFAEFNTRQIATQVVQEGSPGAPSRMGHLVLAPGNRWNRAFVRIDVVPATPGMLSFTTAAVVSVLLLVLISALIRVFDLFVVHPEGQIPSPAGSLLLIGPAVLLSWISREHQHALVVQVTSPLRSMLYLCAATLVIMAALAGIRVTPITWNIAWLGVYAIALYVGLRFLWYISGWGIRDYCRKWALRWKKSQEGHDEPAHSSAFNASR